MTAKVQQLWVIIAEVTHLLLQIYSVDKGFVLVQMVCLMGHIGQHCHQVKVNSLLAEISRRQGASLEQIKIKLLVLCEKSADDVLKPYSATKSL